MTNLPIDGTEPLRHGGENRNGADGNRPGLLSLVVGPTDEPTCTIYPPDVAVPHRSTVWISATGDAFVNLDRCR